MSIYKGNKLVAGGSIDTHFVRRPAWDQAVAVSAADLAAGYTAPSDGMFVCTCSYSVTATITVNNVVVSKSSLAVQPSGIANSTTGIDLCVPVSKSDIIKSDVIIQPEPTYSNIAFVPFEDSTVSDVEVVTPEYIRNQNILSDLESITISTSGSSPTVIPYDGVIYVSYKGAGSTPGRYYLNGQQVLWFEGEYGQAGNSGTLTVKKGDTVYVVYNNASPSAFARFYKLRDYTGR